MKLISRTLSTAIALSILFALSNAVTAYAECISVTCYCGVQVSCGSSNQDCIKACGDDVPSSPSPSPSYKQPSYQPPSYDREAEQRKAKEMMRRKQEAEERAKREVERKRQFEQDKQNALDLLKSDSEQLGLKGTSGSGIKLKGSGGNELKLKGTGYKEPRFSKGHKGSAPVDLKSAPSDKPLIITPEKMKTGALEKGLKQVYVPKPALPSLADYTYENKSRTDIVLDALEVGKGDYLTSVRHL